MSKQSMKLMPIIDELSEDIYEKTKRIN